jgi:zinc protease
MGYLLPALTRQKFENQRDVVLNERRQNYENRPYGMAAMAVVAALFPPQHPYHWPTIGAPADLEAATFEDVRAFFQTYYHPANASLVVAGDVSTEDAIARVRAHFDEIPAGPRPAPVQAAASVDAEVRLVLEDRVELPRLYVTWHSPAIFAPGDAEMDLLADVAANTKASRLYRALVYERRLATEVMALQHSREMAGFWQIVATAAPGHTLEELDAAITVELCRLLDHGPSDDEVERGRAQAEAHFVFRLQTLGGFGGKSDQLNAYHVFLNDPGYFERDLARYRSLEAGDLRDAAQQFLPNQRRVALSVVPRGRASEALSGSVPAVLP